MDEIPDRDVCFPPMLLHWAVDTRRESHSHQSSNQAMLEPLSSQPARAQSSNQNPRNSWNRSTLPPTDMCSKIQKSGYFRPQ